MSGDLSGTMFYDDVRRDIIRRIREADLLPYTEAQLIAASAAHTVLSDVEFEIDRRALANSEGNR